MYQREFKNCPVTLQIEPTKGQLCNSLCFSTVKNVSQAVILRNSTNEETYQWAKDNKSLI